LIFNLLPAPLDGGRVLVGLLPQGQPTRWRTHRAVGFFVVIAGVRSGY
jgi:Zn-dependent protease